MKQTEAREREENNHVSEKCVRLASQQLFLLLDGEAKRGYLGVELGEALHLRGGDGVDNGQKLLKHLKKENQTKLIFKGESNTLKSGRTIC